MPPLSTDYVFMSYSRRDDAAMRRIVAFLREQGIKVWVDNEKLIPGTPVWEKEIEKAVQGASAVVVVLSPDSKDSEWVRREISLADQYEKRVFPLLVRGDEKTSISIRLIGRQYVDIRSNEDAGLNYVSATLLRYLEEVSGQEQNVKKEADRLAAQKIKTEKRLAARKAEEERIGLEKVNAERQAKEDADRLVAQKADEERFALEKVASDRKAKEDADRFAAQKAELESKEKLASENSERKAREKLAREKMERDEREKAKRETKVQSKIEKPVVTKPEPKKQTGMKLPVWGVGLIAFVVLVLVVWKLSSLPASLPESTPVASTLSACGVFDSIAAVSQYSSAPPQMIDTTKQYFATYIMAKGGQFMVELYPAKAPIAVNSFVFLSCKGFFNGVTFHRVLEGFMAQGGDPTGTGTGGPGYEFVNENNDLLFDKAGVLAMANAGLNTNGSQFFITFAPADFLNGGYTIFGQVVEGIDVVNSITRRDPDQSPSFTGDVIKSITITTK